MNALLETEAILLGAGRNVTAYAIEILRSVQIL